MLLHSRAADRGCAGSAGELSCELVTSEEGIRALEPDYVALDRAAGNSLPFALQQWHLCWCAHFLNHNDQIRDQPMFCVVRHGRETCVAIVPLILTTRQVGPIRIRSLDLLGSDPDLTEIRAPLVVPGYERLTVRAVLRSLAKVPDWHWINWRGVSSAFAEALAREAEPRWYEVIEDYVLDLAPSWDQFRTQLPRNVRESLRHCYNSLKRHGHAFEFLVARSPPDVERALGIFLRLHAMRAAMESRPGARHVDRFASGSLQRFLYSLCAALAARDAVRVFQLKIGGEVVATRIAFVVGDTMYLYYSGFDPARRYSVMTTTVAEAFKYAIANGLKAINLSLTREQSKMRWRPRLIRYHSALVHGALLRSRIACRAYRLTMLRPRAPMRLLSRLFAQRDWN